MENKSPANVDRDSERKEKPSRTDDVKGSKSARKLIPQKRIKLGDFVMAKMIGYPIWPGKVIEVESDERKYNVQFFGTNDHSWLSEKFIHLCDERNVKKFSEEIEKLKIGPSVKKKLNVAFEEMKNEFAKARQSKGTKIERRKISSQSKDEESDSTEQFERAKRKRMHSVVKQLIRKKKQKIDCMERINRKSGIVQYLNQQMRIQNSTTGKAVLGLLGSGPLYFKILEKCTMNFSQFGANSPDWDIGSVIAWRGMLSEARNRGIKNQFLSWEENLSEIAKNSDIIVSCFPDCDSFKASNVFSKVLKEITPAKTYIEMTAIDINTLEVHRKAIKDLGGRYLEAPVLGPETFSEGKKIAVMIAGKYEISLIAEVYKYINVFAFPVVTVGVSENQSNIAVKTSLIFHMIKGVIIASLLEALSFAVDFGLEFQIMKMFESIFNCSFITNTGYAMLESDSSLDEYFEAITKCMKYAISMGNDANSGLSVSSAAYSVNLILRNSLLSESEDESDMT